MIIGACGFGSTGSSAVSDYLSEYENIQTLDRFEFSWVSGVDGLIDLDYHIHNPHMRTADSIVAIQRFRERMKKCMPGYYRAGHIKPAVFEETVNKFLDSITMIKWQWYIDGHQNFLEKDIQRIVKRIILKIEKKQQRQINCWPMKEVSFSIMPENFDEAARTHVKEMLKAMGADFTRPIVLDQPFSGNNPESCFKYFDDPYAIVVDRDPRDNYIFANTKLVGKLPHFMPIQPVEDFVKYYRALRDNQPYKQKDDRVLSIKFEDMVYHYDETTKLLRDFLHLPENPNPKTVFDPAISMPNTQLWKRFPQYARDIEYIEKELSEYLFDYTGCPEPDLKGKMFSGKSPKHK